MYKMTDIFLKRVGIGLFYFTLISSFFSCKRSESNNGFPEPPGENGDEYVFRDIQKIFGFDRQSRYSYCPSIIKTSEGTTHVFFCGTQNMIMVDNIYHLKINPDGTQTNPQIVLTPGGSGEWDDHHTCDPSVIEGDFKMNDVRYRYAMFFLGNRYGAYYNEIGVAFSNDLDADTWIKYPHQVVKKTWDYDDDQMIGSNKAWGVGQPSAVSIDHKGVILLTYTIGDVNGTRIVWAKADFSDMSNYIPANPVPMVKTGLVNINYTGTDVTNNADFAIDPANRKIVIVRPVHPNIDNSYPTHIGNTEEVACLSLDDFYSSTGTWKVMVRITQGVTGFPRNHNSGIERNSFGEIDHWEAPVIYYTVSKAAPDVAPEGTQFAEWTYHIWRGKVHKE